MEAFIDPRRTIPRKQPLRAAKHMRALLKDNEDTERVFHIMEALNGDNMIRHVQRFAKSETGAARLAERTELPALLDDHARWAALPAGTVGRAYIDFMQREGLSAAGLVEESEKWWSKHDRFDDDIEYFARRTRDTHDLMHVMSGYGRDQLGETSVLAFTHGQNGGFGHLFIAYIGAWDLRKRAPRSARVMDAIKEARRNGKACLPLINEHIPSLMEEDLASARARMNIAEPIAYKQALAELKSIGYEAELAAA